MQRLLGQQQFSSFSCCSLVSNPFSLILFDSFSLFTYFLQFSFRISFLLWNHPINLALFQERLYTFNQFGHLDISIRINRLNATFPIHLKLNLLVFIALLFLQGLILCFCQLKLTSVNHQLDVAYSLSFFKHLSLED